MNASIERSTSDLLREMREPAPTLADALRQCRNALHDVAIDCAIECKNAEARDTIGSRRATRVALAAANVKTLEDAMALADAALAAADAASQPELTMSMFASVADLEAARASLAQPPAAPAVASEVAMPEPAPHAMQQLTTALEADPDYAWSWHCNLAIPIMDSAKVSHRVANEAGARLMRHLFDIDITKHPHYAVDESDARASQALARVPLSDEAVIDAFCKTPHIHIRQFVSAFKAGARFAERAHGILPAPTEGGAA